MDAHDQPVVRNEQALSSPPMPVDSCARCAERTYLKMLVAELLYKNQTLRFDLLDARQRLANIESDNNEAANRTKSIEQTKAEIPVRQL